MTQSLGKLFNQLTDKHPNKFVIKFNNNEKYSYSELNAFSENFINFFKTLKKDLSLKILQNLRI